jgi:hypothetical protein
LNDSPFDALPALEVFNSEPTLSFDPSFPLPFKITPSAYLLMVELSVLSTRFAKLEFHGFPCLSNWILSSMRSSASIMPSGKAVELVSWK